MNQAALWIMLAVLGINIFVAFYERRVGLRLKQQNSNCRRQTHHERCMDHHHCDGGVDRRLERSAVAGYCAGISGGAAGVQEWLGSVAREFALAGG